jgi:hypothetical protein
VFVAFVALVAFVAVKTDPVSFNVPTGIHALFAEFIMRSVAGLVEVSTHVI